jgi:hypothetical protein
LIALPDRVVVCCFSSSSFSELVLFSESDSSSFCFLAGSCGITNAGGSSPLSSSLSSLVSNCKATYLITVVEMAKSRTTSSFSKNILLRQMPSHVTWTPLVSLFHIRYESPHYDSVHIQSSCTGLRDQRSSLCLDFDHSGFSPKPQVLRNVRILSKYMFTLCL